MRFQPAALLAEHAAGGGDLDDVSAILAGAADFLRAFHRAGAGVTAGQYRIHFGLEARHIAVAANNRQRRSGSDDARSGNDPLRSAAAQAVGSVLRAAGLAHGGEPGQRGQAGVLRAQHHAPFFGLGRFLPEIAAGIAGQMDVQVNQAGQHGLFGQMDHGCAFGRGQKSVLDAHDLAIGDDDRCRSARLTGGVRNHRSGMDIGGFRAHCLGGKCGYHGSADGGCAGHQCGKICHGYNSPWQPHAALHHYRQDCRLHW